MNSGEQEEDTAHCEPGLGGGQTLPSATKSGVEDWLQGEDERPGGGFPRYLCSPFRGCLGGEPAGAMEGERPSRGQAWIV